MRGGGDRGPFAAPGRGTLTLPAWARWPADAAASTIGVEEELMVLDGRRLRLAPEGPRAAEALPEALPEELRRRVSVETHAAALEIHTAPHARVADAVAELARMRAGVARGLARIGLAAASAGTHALALGLDTTVTPQRRYEELHRALGELARREPTFALHVHVGLPDAGAAYRALEALRRRVPLLLALSANSPFWRGRDSRLASSRTFVFGAFPRTGLPRSFGSYREYAAAVDGLIGSGAIPDETFVWWDVRLAPRLGTLEVRAMDAQIDVGATGALVALVQCMVSASADEPPCPPPPPEVLDENRFLAARHGTDAELIGPQGRRMPLGEVLERELERLRPHADALRCRPELEAVRALARESGAARQRRMAGELGVAGVAKGLAEAYLYGAEPVGDAV